MSHARLILYACGCTAYEDLCRAAEGVRTLNYPCPQHAAAMVAAKGA